MMQLENISPAAFTFTTPKLHRTENNRFTITESVHLPKPCWSKHFFVTLESLVQDWGKFVLGTLHHPPARPVFWWGWMWYRRTPPLPMQMSSTALGSASSPLLSWQVQMGPCFEVVSAQGHLGCPKLLPQCPAGPASSPATFPEALCQTDWLLQQNPVNTFPNTRCCVVFSRRLNKTL